MTRRPQGPSHEAALGAKRRTIRYAAATLAALTALVYLAIGFGVIEVVDPATSQPGELLVFGLVAGGAFALGAVLLVAGDWRPVWLVGAAFQVFAIVMYVMVSQERTPPFEVWGVMLRVPQLLMLGALTYLFISRPAGAGLMRRVSGVGP
jgi:hypothetical protein